MVNLIDAERHEAEMSRVRPSVKQFAELLAEHAYVSIHPGKLACNTCLDGKGGGEFATTREWAEHVDNALRRAGLRVGGA